MARPKKNSTGMTPAWRITTMKLPRWLADQIRELAAERGYEESWEVLLTRPRFLIPNPLPTRYRHHGPAVGTGPILIHSHPVEQVLAELDVMGVAYERVGDQGVQPLGAGERPLGTAEEENAAREEGRALYERVEEAGSRIRARSHGLESFLAKMGLLDREE